MNSQIKRWAAGKVVSYMYLFIYSFNLVIAFWEFIRWFVPVTVVKSKLTIHAIFIVATFKAVNLVRILAIGLVIFFFKQPCYYVRYLIWKLLTVWFIKPVSCNPKHISEEARSLS